jgi:hypothetical protein
LLQTAQDRIYFIREMLKGKPEPQIYGSIGRYDTDPSSGASRFMSLEGIKIVVENGENRFETVTDRKGLYVFNDIPAGEYVLKPLPGENYMVYYASEERIEILPNKKITQARLRSDVEGYDSFYGEFSLGWNNRIEGRVVDSQGKPFPRYVVGMLPPAKANEEMSPDKQDSPDNHGENGAFWTSGKTPGKYVLAVDVYAPFGASGNRKRFFFPQAESVKAAKIFDLAAATQLKDVELKLPLTIRYIKGEVFWSDGVPNQSYTWISLRRLEAQNDKNNMSFDRTQAKDGKFTIAALEEFEYWVHPRIYVDVNESGVEKRIEINAKPQKVKIGKADVPLKIIFEKPKNLVEDK